jgi:ribosome-associated toxin RatA of RatAB toxin-antitoxin module
MRYAPVLVPMFALVPGAASAAEQISVEASRQGSAVAVNARATLTAPYALIWATLTDYEHLSEFIPGITASRVIDRRGNAAIVEQAGKVRILFFNYPLNLVVESREVPPSYIGVRALKGNLKQLEGGYRIEKVANKEDQFVLRWSGLIEPSIPVPPFMTVPLMRENISNQFRGMVNEIDRRETQRKAKLAVK